MPSTIRGLNFFLCLLIFLSYVLSHLCSPFSFYSGFNSNWQFFFVFLFPHRLKRSFLTVCLGKVDLHFIQLFNKLVECFDLRRLRCLIRLNHRLPCQVYYFHLTVRAQILSLLVYYFFIFLKIFSKDEAMSR